MSTATPHTDTSHPVVVDDPQPLISMPLNSDVSVSSASPPSTVQRGSEDRPLETDSGHAINISGGGTTSSNKAVQDVPETAIEGRPTPSYDISTDVPVVISASSSPKLHPLHWIYSQGRMRYAMPLTIPADTFVRDSSSGPSESASAALKPQSTVLPAKDSDILHDRLESQLIQLTAQMDQMSVQLNKVTMSITQVDKSQMSVSTRVGEVEGALNKSNKKWQDSYAAVARILARAQRGLEARRGDLDKALKTISNLEVRLESEIKRLSSSLALMKTKLAGIEIRIDACEGNVNDVSAVTDSVNVAVADILQEMPGLREVVSEALTDLFNVTVTLDVFNFATSPSSNIRVLASEIKAAGYDLLRYPDQGLAMIAASGVTFEDIPAGDATNLAQLDHSPSRDSELYSLAPPDQVVVKDVAAQTLQEALVDSWHDEPTLYEALTRTYHDAAAQTYKEVTTQTSIEVRTGPMIDDSAIFDDSIIEFKETLLHGPERLEPIIAQNLSLASSSTPLQSVNDSIASGDLAFASLSSIELSPVAAQPTQLEELLLMSAPSVVGDFVADSNSCSADVIGLNGALEATATSSALTARAKSAERQVQTALGSKLVAYIAATEHIFPLFCSPALAVGSWLKGWVLVRSRALILLFGLFVVFHYGPWRPALGISDRPLFEKAKVKRSYTYFYLGVVEDLLLYWLLVVYFKLWNL